MKQKTKDGILYGIMILATGIILATLLWILFYIVSNGIGSINFAFIFSPGTEKGIFAMIVTTAWLVAVSLAIALPVGIITALFLNEYSKNTRPVRFLRLAIETLAGIPSILYGLFGLLFFSRIMGLGQSILSGALTLRDRKSVV